MEFNRCLATGRLSEILGEATLRSDRYMRPRGLRNAAMKELEMLDTESIALLEAYAAGVNEVY